MAGAEAEIADPFPAEAQAQFTAAAAHEGGAVDQVQADISAGERERRRKGKGIMVEEGVKPIRADHFSRGSPQDSGSGSWDPLKVGDHQEHVGESFSSKDADSRASFDEAKGREVLPEEHARHHDEDVDMGGEGVMGKQERPSGESGPEAGGFVGGGAPIMQKGNEVGRKAQMGGKPVIVISDGSEEGKKKEKGKTTEKTSSKGSYDSVPPGFQRLHRPRNPTISGGRSPFGKMQKGGLRFLKRPASAASSGLGRARSLHLRKTSLSLRCLTTPSARLRGMWGFNRR